MKTKVLSALWMAILSSAALDVVQAQTPVTKADSANDHAAHDHAGHSHGSESVAFVLTNWKTMHFEDASKATQHAETIKKLGCELKQEKHAGHIDVTYRSPQWRTMELPSHKLADQWIGWLKGAGFDVSHGHIASEYAQGAEIVEFRLVGWKTIHGKGGDSDQQVIDQLNKIGCEVKVAQHLGHSDIKYRAPTWRDVHVADHNQAESLLAWLKQQGFEAAPHKH